MAAIEQPQADIVEIVVVEPDQTVRPLGVGEHPGLEPLLDRPLPDCAWEGIACQASWRSFNSMA